jgi:hypothetical protein
LETPIHDKSNDNRALASQNTALDAAGGDHHNGQYLETEQKT